MRNSASIQSLTTYLAQRKYALCRIFFVRIISGRIGFPYASLTDIR